MKHTKESCPYCIGNKLIYDEGRWDVWIAKRKLHVSMLEGEYMNIIHLDIHYCPLCGRKLEDI